MNRRFIKNNKMTKPRKTTAIDISGQRFGKLVAVRPMKERVKKHIMWECLCDCGNTCYKPCGILRARGSSSCGCAWKHEPGEAARHGVKRGYMKTAARKGRSWNLSDELFKKLTSSNCYYCGSPPSSTYSVSTKWSTLTYNGIDRVNSRLGYEPDNVVPCCKRCNVAKNDMSVEDFFAWLSKIYHYSIISKKTDFLVDRSGSVVY